MREAWAAVEAFWGTTMRRASALKEADLHRSVDDEWSFTQTLRHLIHVIDGWFSHAILGEPRPYHPLGLPASYMTDIEASGIDTGASPSFQEVAAVRADRMARVREFLATVTQEELARVREPDPAYGFSSQEARTATACLHVLFDEEWTHHSFAVRDLAVIEAGEVTGR